METGREKGKHLSYLYLYLYAFIVAQYKSKDYVNN